MLGPLFIGVAPALAAVTNDSPTPTAVQAAAIALCDIMTVLAEATGSMARVGMLALSLSLSLSLSLLLFVFLGGGGGGGGRLVDLSSLRQFGCEYRSVINV
jgi:hypothetical protein